MLDNTKIEIKQMQISNLEEIENILFTNFDDLWTLQIFKEELGNNNSSYLVLYYKNEIVCFGGIKIILDEATLMNIVTKKQNRKQGFAKILLTNLIKIAKEKKCISMTLEVNQNNFPALHFYKSFNFKEVGKRKNYYKNGDTAVLMTLDL